MDSQQQLRAMLEMDELGWDLGAIYHSHPRTPAYPSATDIKLAFFPEAAYVILSLARRDRPDVRAFRIVSGQVSEEPLELGSR
jgi:proteasome lid subunit RPN8/RPN11